MFKVVKFKKEFVFELGVQDCLLNVVHYLLNVVYNITIKKFI